MFMQQCQRQGNGKETIKMELLNKIYVVLINHMNSTSGAIIEQSRVIKMKLTIKTVWKVRTYVCPINFNVV